MRKRICERIQKVTSPREKKETKKKKKRVGHEGKRKRGRREGNEKCRGLPEGQLERVRSIPHAGRTEASPKFRIVKSTVSV